MGSFLKKETPILVYGYGNPGRQDDGLGSEFVKLVTQWISRHGYTHIHTDCNYQLNVEDAAHIARYDRVFFVDATKGDIKDFRIKHLSPSNQPSFSSHATHPAYILYLCKKLFYKNPLSFLIEIKGYEWNFMAPITPKAKQNLKRTFSYSVEHFV